MLESQLKRKLRSLKKLERKIRARYLDTHQHARLIWDSYFSTASAIPKKPNIKYPLDSLLNLDRSMRKQVFEEYLYAVFVQHTREESILPTTFQNPEILSFFGLPPHATVADIKKRFRELAHKYHPDKGGDPEQMIQLLEMYNKYRNHKQKRN